MALANSEKFRRAIAAFNRGDVDAALEHADPDVKWEAPAVLPDTQTYHGHRGVRAMWDTMNDAFEGLRLEPEADFKELDETHVLVPIRFFGRGRQSGIEVNVSFFMLGTGRELLERMEFFPSEAEALEAVASRSRNRSPGG
jgi:ketosteroid isomerase-like protein